MVTTVLICCQKNFTQSPIYAHSCSKEYSPDSTAFYWRHMSKDKKYYFFSNIQSYYSVVLL